MDRDMDMPPEHGAMMTGQHMDHPYHEGGGHEDHAAHDKHAGHSIAMFRGRFWVCVLLTLPILLWSRMLQQWLGYTAPSFLGAARIPSAFGTVVFVFGGGPFLQGGVR